MKTSPKQISLFTEDNSTFSQGGFLASHTAKQESDLEKKTNAIYGQKCLEQFERFNHVGSWAKTFSALLIGQEGWFSKRCRLTWKIKGTKYNRIYFQLRVSTLPTNGTGFGLLPTKMLPTPTTMDMLPPKTDKAWEKEMTETRPGRTMPSNLRDVPFRTGLLLTPTTREEVVDLDKFKKRMEKYPNGTTMPNLATQVMGLLPTPKVGGKEGYETRAKRQGHEKAITHLDAFVEYHMLPTPATRDYKGARSSQALSKSGRNQTNSLPDAFHQPGKTSQLNPRFVAEMMGFPPNWTELPFLNGETNQSKPTETQ